MDKMRTALTENSDMLGAMIAVLDQEGVDSEIPVAEGRGEQLKIVSDVNSCKGEVEGAAWQITRDCESFGQS